MRVQTVDALELFRGQILRATRACVEAQAALTEIGLIAKPVDESEEKGWKLLNSNLYCVTLLVEILGRAPSVSGARCPPEERQPDKSPEQLQ